MIAINHLFDSFENLVNDLCEFDYNDLLHFRIFTPNLNAQESIQLAKEIKQYFKNSTIIGASVQGIVHNGTQHLDKTLIVIEKYQNTHYKYCLLNFNDITFENTIMQLNDLCNTKNAKICRALVATRSQDAQALIDNFNMFNPNTKLVGGIASLGNYNQKNEFVFDDSTFSINGLVAETLFNDELNIFTHVNSSHDAISGNHVITKCDGKNILEINNQNIFDWIEINLGKLIKDDSYAIDINKENPLVWFNLLINGNSDVCRFLMYNANEDKIETIGKLALNTNFQIGYTSPYKVISDCQNLINKLSEIPVENLFCYICVHRRVFLKNCADWELASLDLNKYSGAFFHGEICNINNRNEFFNGSTVFCGIAEQEGYMKINVDALENMELIAIQNKILSEYVNDTISKSISLSHKKSLRLILENEENYRKNLYFNYNLELPNLVRFEHDMNLYAFDKICYVRIQNSDLFINYMGQIAYYKSLKNFVELIRDNILKSDENRKCLFNIYFINDDSLVIASNSTCSTTRFIDNARKVCGFFIDESSNYFKFPIMTKTIVVNHEENIIDKVYQVLQNDLYNDSSFIIYEDKGQDSTNLIKKELKILEAIQFAIDNNMVIPYYQPIIDNRDNSIKGYESLMRIFDKDNQIYYPNDFMPIAKKYRLYLDLGAQMIVKVFEQIEVSNVAISINLSAHNINSRRFRKFLLNMLDNLNHTDKVIFEILEDECFNDTKYLSEFLEEAKKYGVSIAVDDFGSGYSNLLELVKIRPSIIKIDGEIVKGIIDNDLNRIIVSAIVALAKNLGVEVVAEHVENKLILDAIKIYGIEYSQGYYFSKPLAIENALAYEVKIND